MSATGYAHKHLPPGPERDELLGLVRIGLAFKAHHVGRRPGPVARLVLACARRTGPPYSFAQLLDELEREAARRELDGERVSTVERVDRIFELATIHLPRRGRVQVTFGALRNALTAARKEIRAPQFPVSPKP